MCPTVSVLGQSPRELREGAVGFGVSPDGTHIAFGPYIPHSENEREIWVMGSLGDNPQKVLALPEGIYHLCEGDGGDRDA